MKSSYGATKSSGQLSLINLVFFDDYKLTLFRSLDTQYFTRKESLAYITNVEFIDFPLIHLQEEFEDEFGHSANDNLIIMFYKRICSQLKETLTSDMHHRVLGLVSILATTTAASGSSMGRSGGSSLTADESKSDEFKLNKLNVVTMSIGKVHGIYTNKNGPVILSFYLKNTLAFQLNKNKNQLTMPLFVQHSSTHFPEPRCTLVAKYTGRTSSPSAAISRYSNLILLLFFVVEFVVSPKGSSEKNRYSSTTSIR